MYGLKGAVLITVPPESHDDPVSLAIPFQRTIMLVLIAGVSPADPKVDREAEMDCQSYLIRHCKE
jgi:hypothetical protein